MSSGYWLTVFLLFCAGITETNQRRTSSYERVSEPRNIDEGFGKPDIPYVSVPSPPAYGGSECNCLRWTNWISADTPGDSGDWETLGPPDERGRPGTIHHVRPDICTIPVRMECRTVADKIPWYLTYERITFQCNPMGKGFACENKKQGPGKEEYESYSYGGKTYEYDQKCHDYEARVLCFHAGGEYDNQCPCLYWTEWFNNDNPTTGRGDEEIIGYALPKYVCEGNYQPVDVQCKTVAGLDVFHSGNKKVQCNLHGLSCLNEDQGKNCKCHDYEVRFLCPRFKANYPIAVYDSNYHTNYGKKAGAAEYSPEVAEVSRDTAYETPDYKSEKYKAASEYGEGYKPEAGYPGRPPYPGPGYKEPGSYEGDPEYKGPGYPGGPEYKGPVYSAGPEYGGPDYGGPEYQRGPDYKGPEYPGASYPSGPEYPGASYPSGPEYTGESYPSGPEYPGASYPSGPDYQSGPRYQGAPRYTRVPGYKGPGYGPGSEYGAPEYADGSEHGSPQYGGPEYGGPEYGGPEYGGRYRPGYEEGYGSDNYEPQPGYNTQDEGMPPYREGAGYGGPLDMDYSDSGSYDGPGSESYNTGYSKQAPNEGGAKHDSYNENVADFQQETRYAGDGAQGHEDVAPYMEKSASYSSSTKQKLKEGLKAAAETQKQYKQTSHGIADAATEPSNQPDIYGPKDAYDENSEYNGNYN